MAASYLLDSNTIIADIKAAPRALLNRLAGLVVENWLRCRPRPKPHKRQSPRRAGLDPPLRLHR